MGIEMITFLVSAATVQGMLWELRKDAYQKGLDGAAGYPLDVATEIASMEDFTGKKLRPFGYKVVADIADLLNREYAAGCNERAKTA